MIASADGCKAGWLVVLSKDWPCTEIPSLYICRDFLALLKLTRPCEAAVVDIPIGLPEGRQPRLCDTQARERLGKAGWPRVFLTPPRSALTARDPKAFQRVHKRLTGKGAAYPVWRLVAKLLEVDKAITPELQDRLREFHPELVWQRLAGKVLESKHSAAGIDQRKSVLRRYVRKLDSIIAWRTSLGRAAKLDDILDAVVGLAVAADVRSGSCSRLPDDNPPTDGRGLRMEIWF